ADPSLTQDPMFAIWYQRLGELVARNQVTFEHKQKLEEQLRQNPRRDKWMGLGFDLISARGLFTVDASVVLKRMVFPRVALDIGTAGLDAGVVVAPPARRWSPFFGIGAHVSAKRLGLDIGGGEGTAGSGDQMYSTSDIFGLHARAEVGRSEERRVGKGGRCR